MNKLTFLNVKSLIKLKIHMNVRFAITVAFMKLILVLNHMYEMFAMICCKKL